MSLSWTLCIATLNRADALAVTIGHALRQSQPPDRIVVVDASDDWQASRDVVAAQVDGTGIALDYRAATVRSSAVQRNEAVAAATGDIVFMLDDDSFMFPDCAAQILAVYGADPDGAVAAVSARLVPEIPPDPADGGAAPPQMRRKASGRRGGRMARLQASRLGRWINRHILLQSKDALFLKYDGPRRPALPPGVAALDVTQRSSMPGSAMTVRRAIVQAEPFDTALRYYAAFEDLDAGYRWAAHGAVVQANRARLHHFEVAGGRLKRRKLVLFQLLNMVVFLKRNAADPEAWRGRYRVLLWRRLLGETLKDGLSRRFDFPQARGVLMAMRHWRAVWARDAAAIDAWYPGFQKTLLEEM